MSILSGSATYRRFTLESPPSFGEGWRDTYRDRLQAMSAKEPRPGSKEATAGWCIFDDRAGTDFDDMNRWLIGVDHIVLGMRVKSRKLPAAELKAELAKRMKAWCDERGVERCPRSVKKELKETLENEWLAQTIPTSTVTELVWDYHNNIAYFASLSDNAGDTVRRLFHRTFGLVLRPESPLDWVSDVFTREDLLSTSPIAVAGGAQ